jgi:hypothetical protein
MISKRCFLSSVIVTLLFFRFANETTAQVVVDVTAEESLGRMIRYCGQEPLAEDSEPAVVLCPDPRERPVPDSVQSAISILDESLTPKSRELVKHYCEETESTEYTQLLIDNAGLFLMSWMRVYWKLETQESRLVAVFRDIGIANEYSISSTILDVFCAEFFASGDGPAALIDVLVQRARRDRLSN